MKRRARGAALIAAVLVAAVVAAIAVALSTRDRYAILGLTRLDEQALATALTREVEVQAAAALSADLEQSRHDDAQEAWARAEYGAARGDFAAVGRLRDAQRLFNLNALAFQPPAAGSEAPDTGVPPPVEDADEGGAREDGRAMRALRELAGDAPAGTPPATSAAPATPGADGDAAPGAETLSPQQIATARFTLLLQALQIPPEILPPLLDWLDADGDTRFPNGAEDEYYTRLEEPYRAANGPFADVSELRLVRGITPEIYAKLAPHVCVLGSSVPLNINTAPAEVLMSLGPGIDRPTADLLIGSREIQPWVNVAAFLKHPLLAGRPLLAQGLTARSSWFELRTRIESSAGAMFRRTLIERLAPNRLRIARRERLYVDG
ncbi:MAG TPA: type II secretion system minor pseudopilin GspK [Gammaproteobacteria bacterium]|nr:type II secretion system minor pseudopilin GspK [Gammaproteobacteria bacterium]